jgi:HAE1 family hydrophobic/amphiphilic exporter-1
LSLIFVYFLLSAQYESYLVPLNSSFIGGRWSYWFRPSLRIGKQYLLPGRFDYAYRSPNAILIVEFATRDATGMDLTKAAIEGARARLRPF